MREEENQELPPEQDLDEEEQDLDETPRRGSPVSLILASIIVLLLVAIGVGGFFILRTTRSAEVPQTMADSRIREVRAQIKKTPNVGGLYLVLANEYFKTKAYDQALQSLTDLQSINPTGAILAESLYAQGKIAEVRGNKDAAIATYLKSLEVTETVDVRWALGTLYLRDKRYDGAVENLERYVIAQSNDADGYAALGAAYEGLGDREKALAAYNKADALIPNTPGILAAIKRLKGQN